jgi:hypothetical protein
VADSLEDAAENLRAGEYGGYTVGMLMAGCQLVEGRPIRYVSEFEQDTAALLALGFTDPRATAPVANNGDASIAGEQSQRGADSANCRGALERIITSWRDLRAALEDPVSASNDAIHINGNDIDIDMGKLEAPFRAAIDVGRKFVSEDVGDCRECEIISHALARIVKAHDVCDETSENNGDYRIACENPVETLLDDAINAAVEVLDLVDRVAELTTAEA